MKIKSSGNTKVILALVLLCVLVSEIRAQTGGTFDLSHSVIAGGGGSNSTGGTYSLSGTAGQNSAGAVSNGGSFILRGGFWAFDSLAPTAADAEIAGRLMTADGRGIRNAVVVLIGAGPSSTRMSRTGSFGYFRFEQIESGQTCIITVNSKLYRFAPHVISLTESIYDLELVALP